MNIEKYTTDGWNRDLRTLVPTAELMVTHVEKCISLSQLHQSKLTDEIFSLEGMSGRGNKCLLNNILDEDLCREHGINIRRYLEVGCWKGSTSVSALYKNNVDAHWIIDNFAEEYSTGVGKTVKEIFTENYERFIGPSPNLIDADCFSINPIEHGISDVNVYFYDGGHTEEDHYNSIRHFYDSLADNFIIIVDDYNAPTVRGGTQRGLTSLLHHPDGQTKTHIWYERLLPSLGNGDYKGWWNGIYVVVGFKWPEKIK